MTKISFVLAAALASTTACTGTDLETTAAPFEGIYRVASHTQNDAACVPGAEVPITEPYAIAWVRDLGYGSALTLLSCASPAACRELRAVVDAGGGFASELSFDATAIDGDALVGGWASTGYADGTTCRMPELTHFEIRLAGAALAITHERTIVDELPASDGLCSTRETERRLAGKACTALELVAAERVEPL